MRHLSDCVEAEYRYDVMYLPVRDDIGVLRDLANYQDKASGGSMRGPTADRKHAATSVTTCWPAISNR
jgi:hypothetical protein